jgi:UDP-glucose 4-epimerase
MSSFTSTRKNELVTGGAGYIGTHTVLSLLEADYDVTVVDNLVNSSEEGLRRVQELTCCDPSRIRFFNANLCNSDALEEVFKASPKFCSCIHFAALKAVGESVQNPIRYYENNIGGTIILLKLMDKYDCKSIVFSSSATVK